MATKTKIWKIDGDNTTPLPDGGFDYEARLEELIFNNMSLLNNDWLLIGRQVKTGFGFIDLLAIDQNGNLVVIELKRDQTHRETIAQALDYGSWAQKQTTALIVDVFTKFQQDYLQGGKGLVFDDYFENHFKTPLPEELNSEHSLVIVAAASSDSTERIINYLSSHHELNINFLTLRVFADNGNSYISRTWVVAEKDEDEATNPVRKNWNGHFYSSFGDGETRSWDDARKYGFISGGGGEWYSKTLSLLSPGDKVWVNIPQTGYVGFGTAMGTSQPLKSALVYYKNALTPLKDVSLQNANLLHDSSNPQKCEYLVPIKWEISLPKEQAVKEVGLFGNQNTVCQPKAKTWDHTVKRLQNLLFKK